MTIYERIRDRRIELNLTQEELAKKVGYVSRSAVNKIEKGLRDMNQTQLIKFAEALKVPAEYLLLGDVCVNMGESDNMSFGKTLKQLRESNGYSMDKLVELYNIKFNGKMNKSTLSRYENELQEPMFTVIVNLAKLFNVTVDYLSGNDCMDKEDSEAIKSLGYIHQKKELSPELEALNTLLHSYGEQILKTNGNYYFGEFSLTEEEINDFLNTAITMLNGVADVVKKRKQKA